MLVSFCLLAPPLAGASIEIGSTAPDFTLRDLDGEELRLSKRRDQGPVVLVFFRGAW